MKFIKIVIIVFLFSSGLSRSLAAEAFFQTPAELSDWLKTKPELSAEEYRQVDTTINYFNQHGIIDSNQTILLGRLEGDRGVARFIKLREMGDLLPATDLFHCLRSRVLEVLEDGKDPAFSARIVHEAMQRKQWWVFPPIYWGMEESQGKLYDALMGGPETRRPYVEREFSPAASQVLKRALEEKWPVVLEEPVIPSDRRPPVQEIRRDTAANVYIQKDRPVHSRASGEKGAMPWVIGFLFLLSTVLAFAFIKSRRGMGK